MQVEKTIAVVGIRNDLGWRVMGISVTDRPKSIRRNHAGVPTSNTCRIELELDVFGECNHGLCDENQRAWLFGHMKFRDEHEILPRSRKSFSSNHKLDELCVLLKVC